MRSATIPRFKSDREAAEFWAAHDSVPYLRSVEPVTVKISPTLRRRIVTRARPRTARSGRGGDDRSVTGAVTIELGPRAAERLARLAAARQAFAEHVEETPRSDRHLSLHRRRP